MKNNTVTAYNGAEIYTSNIQAYADEFLERELEAERKNDIYTNNSIFTSMLFYISDRISKPDNDNIYLSNTRGIMVMALIKCPECGKEISDKAISCPECGCPIEHIKYTTNFSGKKIKVKCPKCGSYNCELYNKVNVIPEKTKTSYKMNVNPLKPFTLVDKKEKTIRKQSTYTTKEYMCKDCGYSFDPDVGKNFLWGIIGILVLILIIWFF